MNAVLEKIVKRNFKTYHSKDYVNLFKVVDPQKLDLR